MQSEWQITYVSPSGDEQKIVMESYGEPSPEDIAEYIFRNDLSLQVTRFSGRDGAVKAATLRKLGYVIKSVESL